MIKKSPNGTKSKNTAVQLTRRSILGAGNSLAIQNQKLEIETHSCNTMAAKQLLNVN